jgi:putative restriction endonuclease
MSIVPPDEQIARLTEGLVASGFSVASSTDPARRPVTLALANAEGTTTLRVFCWNVTSGGRGRPETEFRVQTTRPRETPLYVPGETTLVLGYDADRDLFVAWEAEKHPNPGGSSSLQVSLDTLERAAETGMAAKERTVGGEVEVVTAFQPELVGVYLTVRADLNVGDATIAKATALAASGEEAEPPEELTGDPERRRVISRMSRLVRDEQFRLRVLRAYGSRCAFCDLDASLAEAAHVKSVASGGHDRITNGIASCPTHHKAFDRGLILVQDDLGVSLNSSRLDELSVSSTERERLGAELRERLRLPDDERLRPSHENLRAHRALWRP